MKNNSSAGASKLASIIQQRMNSVAGRTSTVSVELGCVMSGNRIKIDSIPDAIIGADEYSVCKTISETSHLEDGDRILVVWTNTGDLIVIDKII